MSAAYVVVRNKIVVQEIDAMTAVEAMSLRTEPGRLYAQVADENDIENDLQAMIEGVKT